MNQRARRLLVGVLSMFSAASAWAAMPAPALVAQTTDGHIFNLAAQSGHWVIVNYWATWCTACREEMPLLHAFVAAHPNMRIIGLTYEDITPQALRQFVEAHPPGYPVAHVDEKVLPHALKPIWFGMHALPLTYVIAPDGTVAKRWVGELDRAKLQSLRLHGS